MVDEEDIFELLKKEEDFLEYLNQNNNMSFKSMKVLTIDYSQEIDLSRMFTFESILKMMIDDGDSVWRKRRNILLDPSLQSILMVIDRLNNIMYMILF